MTKALMVGGGIAGLSTARRQGSGEGGTFVAYRPLAMAHFDYLIDYCSVAIASHSHG